MAMASPKLIFLVSVLLIFTFSTFACAGPVPSEDSFLHVQNDAVDQSEGAEFELRKLKSRISYLETCIEERTSEINKKDGEIKNLEQVIEDKSNNLALLQKEVRALEEKSSSKVKEEVGEINARVIEVEKQVVHLKKEIELQNKRKEDFKARSKDAEEKIEGQNLKLKNLQKINDDQKSRIHDMQHALEVAEEEMLKAKLVFSSLTRKLKKVHQAWLPPWASAHLVHVEAFVLNHWNENGRPVFDQAIKKALKQKYAVEKWAQSYFETMISKWFSTIKEQYSAAVNVLNPLVQSLSTQAIDYYHLVWSTIEPHIVNIQLTMDPYFQEVKMVVKPHINRALDIAKPHLYKVRLFSKPFSKKVAHYHKKITKKIRVYHSLVQKTLHKILNHHELTKPLATKGLVRLMASILMALPIVLLVRILLQKASKKPSLRQNRSNARRKRKRIRPDK